VQDLNPYADTISSTKGQQRRMRSQRPMPSAEDVMQSADYKNVAFLERFLSPAGKILHRCGRGVHVLLVQ